MLHAAEQLLKAHLSITLIFEKYIHTVSSEIESENIKQESLLHL